MSRKWITHKCAFGDLKKKLNDCSASGFAILYVAPSTAPKGYYDVIAYKDPPAASPNNAKVNK